MGDLSYSSMLSGQRRPTISSVSASTFLLAGSQALGILLEPSGVKRATFNDLAVSPGEASDTVSYIAGTVETVPHLISYFDFHGKKVKNDAQVSQMLINAGLSGLTGYIAGGGHFGGPVPDPPTAYIGLAEGTVLGAIVAGLGQLRTASYRYYCGFLYGICHGPIDSIEAVKVDDRIVSFGAPAGNQFLIDDPQAWGGDHVDGGVYALCKAIPGNFWPTQAVDPYIASQLGANTASWSGKALFLIYGFTGYPESGYFAATPQGSPAVRPLKLRVRRLPNNLEVPDYHDINGDANIVECCFEWLTSPTFGVKKLPLSKIDVASFQLAAQTLFTRGLGISVEMNADTDVESALDKFSALGDLIIYGSFNSGTIRCKVIERDYSIASLPVFRRGPDGSSPELYNVIKVDGFTPGSWANTANDFSFDYIDRNNNYLKATRYAQDTANRMLTGRTRSLSQSLEGVSNGASAALVGTRELRAGSYPRPPLSLSVNRDGYAREPGDVIKYIDNVDNFVKILRVAEVQALPTDASADVELNCTEDQYGVGAAAFNPYVPPGFSLTLHWHFELEDSFSLTDELAKSLAVASNAAVADTLSLSDSVAVQLGVPQTLSASDSINNFVDSLILSGSEPNPSIFSGATFWADGTASSLPGLADLGAVGSSTNWIDRVTGTRNFAQPTSADRPTLHQTGGPNGQPYVSFDSTDSVPTCSVSSSTLLSNSGSTFFIVIRPQRDGTTTDQFMPHIFADGGGQVGIGLGRNGSNNKFSFYWRSGGVTGPFLESTTNFSQNTWYVVECWFDGSSINLRVNGDTMVSTSKGGTGLGFTPGLGIQALTSDLAGFYTWNEDIGSTNRDTFRTQLAAWFGI